MSIVLSLPSGPCGAMVNTPAYRLGFEPQWEEDVYNFCINAKAGSITTQMQGLHLNFKYQALTNVH